MSSQVSEQLLDGQYPASWDEYMGQEAAKEALLAIIESAQTRDDMLPHLLISTPYAGMGKTALGLQVCRATGRRTLPVSGQMKQTDALTIFEDLDDGDILLYDEFHQATAGGERNWGWMLNYLENGTLLTPYGKEDAPKVTFVAMTTEKETLPVTIQDRFKQIDLRPYSDQEATGIAQQLSDKIMGELPAMNDESAAAVARAGSNRPRRMRDLLTTMRDLAVTGRITVELDGTYPLEMALRMAGLQEDGLNGEAVRYLVVMRESFGRSAVGESTLKARLGFGRGDTLRNIETSLVERGLIATTSGGRMLTSAGSRRAKDLAKEFGGI